MKTFLKIMTAILLVSIVGFFVAFAASGFDIDNFPKVFYASADEDFTQVDQSADMDGLNEIYVKGISERITLSNTSDDKISIKYFVSDYKTTTYSNENGKISLVSDYESRRWFINFKIQSKSTDYIEIKIPDSYEGIINLATTSGAVEVTATNTFASVRLNSTSDHIKAANIKSAGGVEIKTTSDKVELNSCDFSAALATVKTTSGKITINNCTFANADIKTTSDNIRIENSSFNDLSIDNTSGSVKLYSVTAGNITAESTSDNIEFHSVTAAGVSAKTSSGGITVTGSVFGTAYFKTSSDSINLEIECDNITAITSSGKITIRVKGSFEEYQMDVKTSSGNIMIDGVKYYSQILNPSAPKYIYAHTSSDNVRINFA